MLSPQKESDKPAIVEAQNTELIPTPTPVDAVPDRAEALAPDPKRSTQAKKKGLAYGPTRGPISTKYTWRKPVTKKVPVISKRDKGVTGPKRKNTQPPLPASAKRSMGRSKDQAQVSLNPEGFYEVKVSYEHISKLATGCGFQTSDIQAAINSDNNQRRAEAHANTTTTDKAPAGENDMDLGRFDPDPDDEMTSEEED